MPIPIHKNTNGENNKSEIVLLHEKKSAVLNGGHLEREITCRYKRKKEATTTKQNIIIKEKLCQSHNL